MYTMGQEHILSLIHWHKWNKASIDMETQQKFKKKARLDFPELQKTLISHSNTRANMLTRPDITTYSIDQSIFRLIFYNFILQFEKLCTFLTQMLRTTDNRITSVSTSSETYFNST